jgi:hypothetical protein
MTTGTPGTGPVTIIASGITLDVAERRRNLRLPWSSLPVVDGDGQVEHQRGVTEVPGRSFLGLPWQRTRGSALLDIGVLAHRCWVL